MRDPPGNAIANLAGRQHGAVSHEQLIACGLDRWTIQRWVKRGHLHPLGGSVYAVGNPRLTRTGAWMAATMTRGGPAVLSHRSAAELLGLLTPIHGPVHITVPRRHMPRRRDVIAHRPRRIDEIDIGERDGIATTLPARTLFDIASTLTPREVRDAFDKARYLDVLDERRLHRLTGMGTGRRGLKLLRELLAEVRLPAEAARSELELLVLTLCRELDLPLPAVNVPLHGFEVDFLWEDERVVVEADGRQGHQIDRRAFDSDRARDAALASHGYVVLRLTHKMLTVDRMTTGRRLQATLAARTPRTHEQLVA